MEKKLSTAVFLYVVAWLVFANFDFDGSDTITAYQLQPARYNPGKVPDKISVTPTRYRINEQWVVSQTADYEPKRYTNCAVIDTENWTCTYDDKSGKFGFRGGEYFTVNLQPGRSIDENWEAVSRFTYVMNYVEWNWASDSWLQKSMVLLVPFLV